jgi:hypothetical protein
MNFFKKKNELLHSQNDNIECKKKIGLASRQALTI